MNQVNREHWLKQRDAKKQIGRAIAKQLPKVRKQVDVARELGLSRVCVDTIESLALFRAFAMMTYEHD